MKTFVQEGNSLTLTAPTGGVVSGLPYVIDAMPVVASYTASEGEDFVCVRTGVFQLKVDASATPTQGAKAYLKTDNTVTTTATGNKLIGAFVGPKDAASFAEVLLPGLLA